ncbi:MAG TPA: nuclear transport factor 2 family protein [Candidatus Eisenbacteria bacterium]|nr:nuclear transport factor 2 family protein [Candidatus Eisenbacteria bacterium]
MRVTTRALMPLSVCVAIAWFAAAGADQPTPRPASQITEGRTLITLPDTTGYSPDERAILTLERGRSAAIARGDTAWLATLYATDFRGVAGNGARIERTDLFRIFGRDDPVSRFLIDELSIHSYGNAATVTGRLRTLGPTGDMTAESRYLHVYAMRESHWRLVAAQATVVPQPAKR